MARPQLDNEAKTIKQLRSQVASLQESLAALAEVNEDLKQQLEAQAGELAIARPQLKEETQPSAIMPAKKTTGHENVMSTGGSVAAGLDVITRLLQAERRAAQLEKLVQTEAALSQAGDEAEILATVARNFGLDPSERLILEYLELDQPEHRPVSAYSAAVWRDGAIQPDDLSLGRDYWLEHSPITKLWIGNPFDAVFVSNVFADPRVDDGIRLVASQLGLQSIAVLPLFSGERWQGLILCTWARPQDFTAEQRFIWQQLLDPVAAVVARRRAYLDQQALLAETELLYNTIRRINEVVDLQSIVAAVAEGLALPAINRAALAKFERNPADDLETMTVSANWYCGRGTPPLPVGRSYPPEMFDIIRGLLTTEPIIFDDIQHDDRIRVATLTALRELNILALIVLPLWVGERLLGALLLESDEVYRFTDFNVRSYTPIAHQMAITIDNQRLLAETRAALAEVEATQRRYTLQAWHEYRSRNSVASYEHIREGEALVTGNLPPEVEATVLNYQASASSSPADLKPAAHRPGEKDKNAPDAVKSNLLVPLTVRDQVIGVLGLQETDKTRQWLPEEIWLVEAIAREMALAAENLRLLDETQQQAAREKRVNEIGEKIQAAQSLEEALQIAVKEVGLSLHAPKTTVQLTVK